MNALHLAALSVLCLPLASAMGQGGTCGFNWREPDDLTSRSGAHVYVEAPSMPAKNPIGLFTAAAPSDTNGTVTVHFTPSGNPYLGRIRIMAAVDTIPTVRDTTMIVIVPP
jgi:hypothetical protein